MNLRYFFDSVRYSEDIDLDLLGVPSWNLEKKVDDLLAKGTLSLLLRPAEVSIAEFSKPKQTDTTQRWKIGLHVPWRREALRTKVEFSHREGEGGYRLEPIPARIVEPYALRAPVVQHYTGDVPAEQKVAALAGRSETQARDVFDLDLLLRRKPLPQGAVAGETLEAAAERALELPFDAFRDQVLPFLESDAVELYDAGSWEQMQTFVAAKLEELA
ncbi:MAG: nucleotidyl transferase AbiEii/AbiGii toxin family protein [Actinomycetota bacterium]|nr:nucleotidyl transferase AbiEii/AbiGii toxin family protein [Actinomycetota bacterium]